MNQHPKDNQEANKGFNQKSLEKLPNRSNVLKGSVSSTAFLVCESRARKVDISKDLYARHWIEPDLRETISEYWEEFSREVYPYDDLEIGLRNRYWLEQLMRFVRNTKNPIFVNIGSGLTSYPFLLESSLYTLEFDTPVVAAYKNARIKELQQQNFLPRRNVSCYPIDLNSKEDLKQLGNVLQRKCKSRPTFVLCEGLIYYLNRSAAESLIGIFRDFQWKGSLLGIDFWSPDVSASPVFQRMQDFFAKHFGLDNKEYTFFEDEWLTNITGYEVTELTNVVEQEILHTGSKKLQNDSSTLFESYLLLKRS